MASSASENGNSLTKVCNPFGTHDRIEPMSLPPGYVISDDAFAEAKNATREVGIAEGADVMAIVSSEWQQLTDRASTPFQSWAVASAVADAHLMRGELPRVVIVRRAGRPVLIFPTVVTSMVGLPVVRFLGDPLIQYGDVLAAPDACAEEFYAAWSAALDPSVACFASLRRVRDDAKIFGLISQKARPATVQESPLIDLRCPDSLRVKDARELRRLRRRLAECGPVAVRFVNGPGARELLREALRLTQLWIAEHGLASAVIGNAHWEQAIYKLCRDGLGGLTMAALTVAGRVAAVEAAYVDATCWYGFLGAYAPEFASLGPGQVLTAECLARARALGLSCFDQLPPAQPFKRRQATGAIAVRDYTVTLTPVGRLASVASALVPEVKALFGALPPDVRRSLLTLSGSWRARDSGPGVSRVTARTP
jgi:CelD/BcsL family acetyltransferase involved in cellulose biosynthesis